MYDLVQQHQIGVSINNLINLSKASHTQMLVVNKPQTKTQTVFAKSMQQHVNRRCYDRGRLRLGQLTLWLCMAALATTVRSDCTSRLPGGQPVYLIPQEGSQIGWNWRPNVDHHPAEFTSSTYGALAPEFSTDAGLTWTSAANTCSHVSEGLAGPSNVLVNFSRSHENTKTSSKDASSVTDAVQRMQDALQTADDGSTMWALDSKAITLDLTGSWLVSVTDPTSGAQRFSFEMIVVTGCHLDVSQSDALFSLEPYIWPQPKFKWAEFAQPSQLKSTLPLVSDAECYLLFAPVSAMPLKLLTPSSSAASDLIDLKDESEGGIQRIFVSPKVVHSTNLDDLPDLNQKFDVTILAQNGGFYAQLLMAPLEMVNCATILEVDLDASPRTIDGSIDDDGVPQRPVTIVRGLDGSSQRYTNLEFSFKRSRKFENDEKSASIFEKCLFSKIALETFEVHCSPKRDQQKPFEAPSANQSIPAPFMSTPCESKAGVQECPQFSARPGGTAPFDLGTCHLSSTTKDEKDDFWSRVKSSPKQRVVQNAPKRRKMRAEVPGEKSCNFGSIHSGRYPQTSGSNYNYEITYADAVRTVSSMLNCGVGTYADIENYPLDQIIYYDSGASNVNGLAQHPKLQWLSSGSLYQTKKGYWPQLNQDSSATVTLYFSLLFQMKLNYPASTSATVSQTRLQYSYKTDVDQHNSVGVQMAEYSILSQITPTVGTNWSTTWTEKRVDMHKTIAPFDLPNVVNTDPAFYTDAAYVETGEGYFRVADHNDLFEHELLWISVTEYNNLDIAAEQACEHRDKTCYDAIVAVLAVPETDAAKPTRLTPTSGAYFKDNAGKHYFKDVTLPKLTNRSLIGSHYMIHVIKNKNSDPLLSTYFDMELFTIVVNDPCDVADFTAAFDSHTIDPLTVDKKDHHATQDQIVANANPLILTSKVLKLDSTTDYINIMTQQKFKFTGVATEFDLLDHTVENPCGDWSVTDLAYTPADLTGVAVDNHGFLTVTAASDLPETLTPDVQAQVLTVSFTITFHEHGVINTPGANTYYKTGVQSAELMLGKCNLAMSLNPISGWQSPVKVFRELRPQLEVGKNDEIAFTFGEGQRCGGVLTQSYHIMSYNTGTGKQQGTYELAETLPLTVLPVADFPDGDYEIWLTEKVHPTITQLEPNQFSYMDMTFKHFARTDLTFEVVIKGVWVVGTYEVPTSGATASPIANPTQLHTPVVEYEMKTMMTSYWLKLVVTKNDKPDESQKFKVVQKATLPEETPNEIQTYPVLFSEYTRQYIFVKPAYGFAKEITPDITYEQGQPCYPGICTVLGDPVTYSITEEFPFDRVPSYQWCVGDDVAEYDDTPINNPSTALQEASQQGWNETAFTVSCGQWDLDNENTEIEHRIRVYDSVDPTIFTYINVECQYDACFNWVAYDPVTGTGDIGPEFAPEIQTRLDVTTYLVYKGSRKIKLPEIFFFCDEHTLEQHFISTQVMLYDNETDTRSPLDISLEEVNGYGITWDEEYLTISAANETWYNYTFEIIITPRAVEEPAWFNTTSLRILYVKPPCEVSQTRLNSFAFSNPIVLKAVKGVTTATHDLTITFEMANRAFKTDQRTFCGEMLHRYVDQGKTQPFTTTIFEANTVTLAPKSSDPEGEFGDVFVEFYDSKEPISMKIEIRTTVAACDLTSVRFQDSKILETMEVGSEDSVVNLPNFKMPAGCNTELKITQHSMIPLSVPSGTGLDSLISYDEEQKAFTIKKQTNLSLVGKGFELTFQVKTDFQTEFALTLSVTYASSGPQFVDDPQEYSVIPITCSAADSSWQLQLPEIVGGEDATAGTKAKIMYTSAFANQFEYVEDSRTIYVKKKVSNLLEQGYCCPSYETEFPVAVELRSETLGQSTQIFYFKVEAAPGSSSFDLTSGKCSGPEEVVEEPDADFVPPSMTISKISFIGEVTVEFSEPFVVRQDLQILKGERKVDERGGTEPNFQVIIQPVPDQPPEAVDHTWEPVSWTSTQLTLQLSFAKPYQVSAIYGTNQLILKVLNEELFVRASDFAQLVEKELSKEIPLQTEAGIAATLGALGDSVGGGGKIFTILILVLNLFLSFSANQILSQVRSLSMITHLQMMQLNVPPSAIIFFSALFEFVTFDIIPTEDIYAALLAWDNVPYSESAENIGYASRQIIENTGSVPIFLLIITLEQLIFAIIVRIVKSGKLNKYAVGKREGFYYAGATDFFNETYINVCFAVCINTSYIAFGTTALMINTCIAFVSGIGIIVVPLVFAKKLSKAWKPLELEQEDSDSSSDDSDSGDLSSENVDQPQPSQEQQNSVAESNNSVQEDQKEQESELGSEYYREQESQSDQPVDEEEKQVANESVEEFSNRRLSHRRDSHRQHFEGGEAEARAESRAEALAHAKALVEATSSKVLVYVRPGVPITEKEIARAKHVFEKKKLRALEKKQEEHDNEISERYGTVTSMLADRFDLSRTAAVLFVICYFFRRLAQAFIILALFKYPVVQIGSTLILNFSYLLLVVHLRPYKEKMDQTFEMVNEGAIVLTIYLMMLFTNEYIPDGETRQKMGMVTIGVSVTNLFINFIPIGFGCKRACREAAIEKKRKAEMQRKLEQKQAKKDLKKLYQPSKRKERLIMAKIKELEKTMLGAQNSQLDIIPEEDEESGKAASVKDQGPTLIEHKKQKIVKKKVKAQITKHNQEPDNIIEMIAKNPVSKRSQEKIKRIDQDQDQAPASGMIMIRTDQPGTRLPERIETDCINWVDSVGNELKQAVQETRKKIRNYDSDYKMNLKELEIQITLMNELEEIQASKNILETKSRASWFQRVLEFAVEHNIEPLPPVPAGTEF